MEIAIPNIENRIYSVRGLQVMLDSDLAELYNAEPRVLNQAVKRNSERFPENFCFQLTDAEWQSLRSQFVTLETGKGKHRKYLPFVFTEQGVSMHNSQYAAITLIENRSSHDRFLILDNTKLYHLGASLKDLGSKCFAFSRMDDLLTDLQTKLLKR